MAKVRVVVGWSYTNTKYFCQLKGWKESECLITVHDIFRNLQGVSSALEMWVLGPYDLYEPRFLGELQEALYCNPDLCFTYGDTDTLLGVKR